MLRQHVQSQDARGATVRSGSGQLQVETSETLNAVIFPFSKANYRGRAHTHTYVSGAPLWSTDMEGFGSNTLGVPPEVKSCLSDWRGRVNQGQTEVESESAAKPKATKFREC